MHIVSIDFGGTRLRAGRFNAELELLGRAETLTLAHESQASVIDRIIQLARRVCDGTPTIVGISAPCPTAFTGIISHAAVLPNWHDVPLATIISEAFGGAPVYMENDANLGALAEVHQGAARGANPAVYMTISTGIGGGLVIDGNLFTGKNGLAIEPGHAKYRGPDGAVYSLQDFASGPGIARLAQLHLAQNAEPSTLRDLSEITGKAVGDAAIDGDVLANAVIAEAGWWLGLGLVNVAHMFNPELIVLGGSVINLGDLILNPARQVLRDYVVAPSFYHDDLLRTAQLGDDVCLIGAAAYAYQASQSRVDTHENL
jgi:glucokinase